MSICICTLCLTLLDEQNTEYDMFDILFQNLITHITKPNIHYIQIINFTFNLLCKQDAWKGDQVVQCTTKIF